jgi:hypothetical protein
MRLFDHTSIQSIGILAMVILLMCGSCKDKRHHLIEDVTKRIRHEYDTIGVSHILRRMHGVWMERKYRDFLQNNQSINKANNAFKNNISIINIDSRQFLSDSLPFVAMNANDSRTFDGCFYFYRNDDGSIDIVMESRHPVLGISDAEIEISFEQLAFEDFLVLNQDFGDGAFAVETKDRYAKITDDVSDKVYDYDPLVGVEILTRKFIEGTYNVYNGQNRLLMRQVRFNPDGTIDNHPFAKYRMLPSAGFDALMIEGLPLIEEQGVKAKYYGFQRSGNDLELYRIVRNREDKLVFGELMFVLRQ